MKKKFEWIKTIQLILYLAITVVAIVSIFLDEELYQAIGRNATLRSLCVLLWASLALSFIGIYWDFATHHSIKRDYRELDYIAHNDHVAGIANRFTCDAMIEKYVDRPLPDNIGCIMLELSNLREINDQYGHVRGNEMISEFSNMLHTASLGVCFVGRNGGNKFMALFEDCTEEKLSTFMGRIVQQVEANNVTPDMPRIEYRTGRAFSRDDDVKTINRLIGLADRRLNHETDSITGLANRASCDDIINLYLERELPDDIGCMMFEISNIRQINENAGRREGNLAIVRFSDILREASKGVCFVGRNGGVKFLAVFEHCDSAGMDAFAETIAAQTAAHNAHNAHAAIEFCCGKAYQGDDKVDAINRLVALSDRRLAEKRG